MCQLALDRKSSGYAPANPSPAFTPASAQEVCPTAQTWDACGQVGPGLHPSPLKSWRAGLPPDSHSLLWQRRRSAPRPVGTPLALGLMWEALEVAVGGVGWVPSQKDFPDPGPWQLLLASWPPLLFTVSKAGSKLGPLSQLH